MESSNGGDGLKFCNHTSSPSELEKEDIADNRSSDLAKLEDCRSLYSPLQFQLSEGS